MTPHSIFSLPPTVRYRLLAAGCGKHHLAETARTALAEAKTHPASAQDLIALAKTLFSAAWLADPLDGTLSADLAEFDRQTPSLTPAGAKCVNLCAKLCVVPAASSDSRLVRLEQTRDYPALRALLMSALSDSPGNGHFAWKLYHHALEQQDFPTAIAVADRLKAIPPIAPVAAKLAADALFLSGNYTEAAQRYAMTENVFPGLCLDRLGEALHRAGEEEAGIRTLYQALGDTPWMTNALLRLHDILAGLDTAAEPIKGSTAILLYSWNNAGKLDLTLGSLHATLETSSADVLVRVLDNGSTDETPAVVEKWRTAFGERFDAIRLPVNVGAPAARNWLIHLDDIAGCDFVAYLDDDATLPIDWLNRFGAAIKAYPQAGLWGCRVVDYQRPANVQQVDLSILPPTHGDTLFSLSDAHLSAGDFGQFSYMRPATSVTGCCHLFRTKTLLESGDFDLRFSPTQYDDLDHDLRLVLSGETIVYQGHLAVEHMKLSGSTRTMSRAAAGNAMANRRKLEAKYAAKDMESIRDRALDTLQTDFAEKITRMENLTTR